jgi:hypothetical protein
MAYELTGTGEGKAAAHVGKRVEIAGTLKAAEVQAGPLSSTLPPSKKRLSIDVTLPPTSLLSIGLTQDNSSALRGIASLQHTPRPFFNARRRLILTDVRLLSSRTAYQHTLHNTSARLGRTPGRRQPEARWSAQAQHARFSIFIYIVRVT